MAKQNIFVLSDLETVWKTTNLCLKKCDHIWTGNRSIDNSYLEEVIKVFEHANADLIQVFEEAIEDGDQIGRRQLVSQDDCQLVDGESQCAPHLPLKWGGWHNGIIVSAMYKQV